MQTEFDLTQLNLGITAKPFLKWAGGKSQLIGKISDFFPSEINNGGITKYVEPFIGGGALFFYVAQNFPLIKSFYISDANPELAIAYRTIQQDVEALIALLGEIEKKYHALPSEKQKEYFYETREDFNQKLATINAREFESNWIERTATIIFLNRTCFNGLFRVNSKGGFNVPFGDYKNPKICDAENLTAVSILLQRATVAFSDFTGCENFVDSETFVYFDPPYRPISATASFNSYAKDSFGDDEQRRLAEFYRELDKKKAKLMLSNSDPKNINPEDHFFETIYQGFQVERVKASRMINSNAKKRGEINELLILNYRSGRGVMKYHPIFNQYIQCKDSKQVFEYLQNSFANSITMWDYFVNWNKVLGNVHDVEVDLNTLNYLVGKPDAGEALAGLLETHPHLVSTIPILLASREKDFSILLSYLNGNLKHKDFSFEVKSKLSKDEISDICEFARKTGLFDLFEKKIIKSLPDYVLGVEVGLDSNGRKNRGGTTMENLVGEFATKLCETNGYDILSQANASEIERSWGRKIEVDKSSRRFDFAIRKGKEIYIVETNFYGGGGSKLKATAGEYKSLYDFLSKQGIHFIWVTDGLGWETTLRPLEEAFNHIDYVLNLKMMTCGLFAEIIDKGL